MDFKLLLSIMNRPWCIEPQAAQLYGNYAMGLLAAGNVPVVDKRWLFGNLSGLDRHPLFRVDANGAVRVDGPVQVIRINHAIAKYDYCGMPGTQSIEQFIAAANADPTVAAVLLWIDSPGGTVDGTESLAKAVRGSSKPKVTYTDSQLCSAAYWVGSSSDEVVAHGANDGWNASIGSIGTYARLEDHTGKMEKEGVKVHLIPAKRSKDKLARMKAVQAGDFSILEDELTGLNDSFVNAVQDNRAGKLKLNVEDVFTGKVYNANQSLDFGLIDHIGDFQFAVKRALALARASSSNTSTTTTIMKFPNTMTAAKADKDFEVRDEGILLTAEQLGNVEEALTTSASTIADNTVKLTEAGNKVAELNGQINTLTTQAAADQKTIADLRAENERLGKLDAGDHKSANSGKPDDFGEGEAESFETSYDRELKAARG